MTDVKEEAKAQAVATDEGMPPPPVNTVVNMEGAALSAEEIAKAAEKIEAEKAKPVTAVLEGKPFDPKDRSAPEIKTTGFQPLEPETKPVKPPKPPKPPADPEIWTKRWNKVIDTTLPFVLLIVALVGVGVMVVSTVFFGSIWCISRFGRALSNAWLRGWREEAYGITKSLKAREAEAISRAQAASATAS